MNSEKKVWMAIFVLDAILTVVNLVNVIIDIAKKNITPITCGSAFLCGAIFVISIGVYEKFRSA